MTRAEELKDLESQITPERVRKLLSSMRNRNEYINPIDRQGAEFRGNNVGEIFRYEKLKEAAPDINPELLTGDVTLAGPEYFQKYIKGDINDTGYLPSLATQDLKGEGTNFDALYYNNPAGMGMDVGRHYRRRGRTFFMGNNPKEVVLHEALHKARDLHPLGVNMEKFMGDVAASASNEAEPGWYNDLNAIAEHIRKGYTDELTTEKYPGPPDEYYAYIGQREAAGGPGMPGELRKYYEDIYK